MEQHIYVLECQEGLNSGERVRVEIRALDGEFSPWHLPLTGWVVAEATEPPE